MTPNRKDSKVTRLDLRIPNDIYSQVEEIARANNEPSHHITGNIILSPTLIKLISLGIRSISGNYSELADISTNIGQVPDTLPPRVDTIERELTELKKIITELSDKISVTVSDNKPDTSRVELSGSSDELTDILSDNVSDINRINVEYPIADVDDKQSDKIVDNLSDNVTDNNRISVNAIALSTTTKTTPSRIKPEGEPDWVNKENKRFYSQLVGNSELISKVSEAIALHHTDNKALAESLVSLGFRKQDGTALDSASMSRIKGVVKNLNTSV